VKYCSQSLPAHKIPKHVMFVVSLPREATGKMEKRVLREFVESRLGGRRINNVKHKVNEVGWRGEPY